MVCKVFRKQAPQVSSRNLREKLEESCSVGQVHGHGWFEESVLDHCMLIHRRVDLNSEKALATGGIFLLIFSSVSCIFRLTMSNASQLIT